MKRFAGLALVACPFIGMFVWTAVLIGHWRAIAMWAAVLGVSWMLCVGVKWAVEG